MKIYVYKNIYGWQTIAKNGEDKMYLDVQFKKGMDPQEDYCQIEILDAFFSMYKNKQGLARPKLVIMNYQVILKNDNEEISNDDLPF